MKVKEPPILAKARIRKGYSQYDLAALCKCSQAAISGLETGNMPSCSEDLAKAVAKWLDRDVDELFTRHDGSRVARVTNAAGSRRHPVAAVA